MEGNKEPVLITLSEAELAERLGISRVTAWRLRREGRLPYFRIGRKVRYSEEHIAEFLGSCEHNGESHTVGQRLMDGRTKSEK